MIFFYKTKKVRAIKAQLWSDYLNYGEGLGFLWEERIRKMGESV